MKITIAQLNPTVGDVAGNLRKLEEVFTSLQGSDLLVVSKSFLSGYPLQGLASQTWLMFEIKQAITSLQKLSLAKPETGILVSVPSCKNADAALLISQGEIREITRTTGTDPIVLVPFKGETLGIILDEELPSSDKLLISGATILINLTATPFILGEDEVWFNMARDTVIKSSLPMVRVNQVGGNDELIFAGNSRAFDNHGKLLASCAAFTEDIVTVDTSLQGNKVSYEQVEDVEQVYQALSLGLKDYVHKCGFGKVITGLSGGLDSAVACAIAVNALGKENVIGVTMPGPYSLSSSVPDAEALAKNLGIEFHVVPITSTYESYLHTLESLFAGTEPNVAEENIQARVRGNILMAISNKFGGMVLVNSNKSETAVGYSTLYGDMSGGLAVLSDVYKTMVYRVAHFINKEREIIPTSTITKPPSAELRPDQKDEDSLPPYEILDAIIELYLSGKSCAEIVAMDFALPIVERVIKLVNGTEYKRRQAAPGLHISRTALGQRNTPIVVKNRNCNTKGI